MGHNLTYGPMQETFPASKKHKDIWSVEAFIITYPLHLIFSEVDLSFSIELHHAPGP